MGIVTKGTPADGVDERSDAGAAEADRLAALHDYGILDTSPEEPFDKITRLIGNVLDIPVVLVSLVDEDRQWFKSRHGLDATETARDISFCTHAIRKDTPFVVADARRDERFRDNPLVTGGPAIRSYTGIPLKTPAGFNIGTLCAIDTRPRELSDREIDLLRDLSHLVVDLLELRKLASTDSLTGALTRRNFVERFGERLAEARDGGEDLSIVHFDIDRFGLINDAYGHGAGDLVLQRLAQECRTTLRNGDLFGRMGGASFAIAMALTGTNAAGDAAERLRHRIEGGRFEENGDRVRVTASFGVAAFTGGEAAADLLDRAAAALDRAKAGGRNRCVVLDSAGQPQSAA